MARTLKPEVAAGQQVWRRVRIARLRADGELGAAGEVERSFAAVEAALVRMGRCQVCGRGPLKTEPAGTRGVGDDCWDDLVLRARHHNELVNVARYAADALALLAVLEATE